MKIQGFSFAFATLVIGAASIASAQTNRGAAASSAPALQTVTVSETSRSVQNGRKLFLADGCSECHGTVGQGGGMGAPRLSPMLLPYQAFVYQLRTPYNNMPPFEAQVVPDKDAADIYVFLKSIPPSRPVADIPLLNN